MNNTCVKCGMTTSDNQQLCESCINREITLDKMYEFYNQIKIIDIYKNKISLSEISERCGYLDYIYFSKRFKSVMGMSPREYRNQ